MASGATHIHRARKQVHDDVAAAEDRHRQTNIDKRVFQRELSGSFGTHASGVLIGGCIPEECAPSRCLGRTLNFLSLGR